MGPAPYFPRSMRRQLIRLLRYSIFGRDMLPISQEESLHPRGNNRSTTIMILGRDQIPTSKEDLFLSSARRRTIRLLQYSTYGSDMLLISQKDLYIHETTIGRLLREHLTTTVLEETNQNSQYQGNQPIGRQLKRKYYTSECQKYSN